MLVLAVALTEGCKLFQYDHEAVTPEELGIWVDLTQQGLERYVVFNSDYIMKYLQTAAFPDVVLEALGFQLSLVDLKLADIGFTNVELVFGEGGADMRVRSFRLAFDFRFVIRQLSYPYLEDDGPGYLRVDIDVGMRMTVDESESCPYHLELDLQHGTLGVNKL